VLNRRFSVSVLAQEEDDRGVFAYVEVDFVSPLVSHEVVKGELKEFHFSETKRPTHPPTVSSNFFREVV
jgi:hypothetical protein